MKFKGRESVKLESVRWNRRNPVIVNQRKFDVDFRQSYLFDDDDNYLDRFEKLLLNRRPAEFICRVTLKDKNGKRTVDSAALEQLIDE